MNALTDFSSVRKRGVHFAFRMLDRGYSYEAIKGAIMKARRGEVAKPVHVVGTVRNPSGQFSHRGPWKIGTASSISNEGNIDDKVISGKPFFVEGAECALGACTSICGSPICATVLRE